VFFYFNEVTALKIGKWFFEKGADKQVNVIEDISNKCCLHKKLAWSMHTN